MRNLTITLTSEDGKLQVSESTGWPEGYPPSEPWLAMIIKELDQKLSFMEDDMPLDKEPGYPGRHAFAAKQKALDVTLNKGLK